MSWNNQTKSISTFTNILKGGGILTWNNSNPQTWDSKPNATWDDPTFSWNNQTKSISTFTNQIKH